MPDLRAFVAEAQSRLEWAPPWALSLLLLALAAAAALLVHAAIVAGVRRLLRRRNVFWRPFVQRTRRPGRLAMLLLAVGFAAPAAPFSEGQLALVAQALRIGFILLVGWAVVIAIDVGAALYMRRFHVDVEDNLVARKHLTQVRILRRAASVLVGILTAGLALMTIGGVREWGVSLLAAGGAASIIVGLALQPLLSNLIAGIQIAVTQPIRIDDAVVVEGEFGNVEEISATYVVVRLWDQRRLVLPLTYFNQHPFQNWTRESASLIGTVMLYVDYAAPIDRLRRKLEEIVAASPLWDGKVVNLAVTELSERTMHVRCLVSARNAGQTFDLRAEVREKMIAFLRSELPEALPRTRFAVTPTQDAAASPEVGPGAGRTSNRTREVVAQ
jgi:small-conductance mechanosensitive channel